MLEEGFSVRGSIDLVERAPDGALRATDYKTGKVRAEPGMVIGGGKTLQPALYALALEQLFPGTRVKEGRLYYSSFTGSFTAVGVPLDRVTRESVKTVATTIGEAVARAGGVTDQGAPNRVRVIRFEPNGQQQQIKVNLADPSDNSRTLPVRSGDQIVVDKRKSFAKDILLPGLGIIGSLASLGLLIDRVSRRP